MSKLSLKLLLSNLYCGKCYANTIYLNLDKIRTFKVTFSSELLLDIFCVKLSKNGCF